MKKSRIDWYIYETEGMTSLTREKIRQIQLNKLNLLLQREKDRDGFYRNLPEKLGSLDELTALPFTEEKDLAEYGGSMLLLSQGEVQKVITGFTSGTGGPGKRVFYTEKDCRNTIKLFEAGIGEFVCPGDSTMICMPFSGPFGLGELIAEAVENLGGRPVRTGTGKTYGELAEILETEQPTTFIGMPAVLLSMLRMCGKKSLRDALISGDACPPSVVRSIEDILGRKLWPHYGSREMGLGGAICCPAHEGMHLRENHVIAEVVGTDGNPVLEGEFGELVITTIGMEAQPLIRYRTGDRTRIMKGICPCGSEVLRLDTVTRLRKAGADRGDNLSPEHLAGRRQAFSDSITALDDKLFSIPWLVDYRAEEGEDGLNLQILTRGNAHLEVIRNLVGDKVRISCRECKMEDRPLYTAKRFLIPREKQE